MKIKRKNSFLKKITIFLFSVLCISGCIFIAQFFASALTTGIIQVSSNVSNNFSDFKVYAISVGSYSTRNVAESIAISYRQKNAAGYIHKKNEKYYIIVSAYEKENDAKLVKDSLEQDNLQCEIIMLSFSDVSLQNVSSTTQEKIFLDSLNIFKKVFVDLYDISISLDTKVIDEIRAKIDIITIKARIEEKLQRINQGATSIDGIYYQMIRNKYNELLLELESLKNYEQEEDITFSAQIKLAYMETLRIAEDLIDLLNNEV